MAGEQLALSLRLTAQDLMSPEIRAAYNTLQQFRQQVSATNAEASKGIGAGGNPFGSLSQQAEEATAGVRGVAGALGGFFGSASQFATGILEFKAFELLSENLRELATVGFEANKMFEQQTVTLQAFTHSAGTAQEMVKALEETAVEAGKRGEQVLQMGVQLGPVARTTADMTRDVRAALELSAINPLIDMQMAARVVERATQGDYTLLARSANIPATFTQQAKAQGLEGIDLVENVLAKMGGDWQLVTAQGQTFTGQMNVLGHEFENLQRIGTAELFSSLEASLKGVNKAMSEANPALEKAANTLSRDVTTATGGATTLGGFFLGAGLSAFLTLGGQGEAGGQILLDTVKYGQEASKAAKGQATLAAYQAILHPNPMGVTDVPLTPGMTVQLAQRQAENWYGDYFPLGESTRGAMAAQALVSRERASSTNIQAAEYRRAMGDAWRDVNRQLAANPDLVRATSTAWRDGNAALLTASQDAKAALQGVQDRMTELGKRRSVWTGLEGALSAGLDIYRQAGIRMPPEALAAYKESLRQDKALTVQAMWEAVKGVSAAQNAQVTSQAASVSAHTATIQVSGDVVVQGAGGGPTPSSPYSSVTSPVATGMSQYSASRRPNGLRANGPDSARP